MEMRGRDEMDGQPEARECGMQSSQWSQWELSDMSEMDGQAREGEGRCAPALRFR